MPMNKRLEIADSLYVRVSAPAIAVIHSHADDTFYASVHGPLADQYAQLFTSAPELLAALRTCHSMLEIAYGAEGDTFGIHHNDAADALGAAEVAIAQATGQ